jgi:hypothetical protein
LRGFRFRLERGTLFWLSMLVLALLASLLAVLASLAGSAVVKDSVGSQKRLAILWFSVRARELGSAGGEVEVGVEVEAKVVDLPVHAGELVLMLVGHHHLRFFLLGEDAGKCETHSYTAQEALLPTFKLPTSISTFRHVAAAVSSKSSQRPVREGPLQRRIGGEVVLLFLLGFHGIVVWGFARRASWSGERRVE